MSGFPVLPVFPSPFFSFLRSSENGRKLRAVRRSSVHWFTALLDVLLSSLRVLWMSYFHSLVFSGCLISTLSISFGLYLLFSWQFVYVVEAWLAPPSPALPNGLAHQGQNTPPKHGYFTTFPYFPRPVLRDMDSRHQNQPFHITFPASTLLRRL